MSGIDSSEQKNGYHFVLTDKDGNEETSIDGDQGSRLTINKRQKDRRNICGPGSLTYFTSGKVARKKTREKGPLAFPSRMKSNNF